MVGIPLISSILKRYSQMSPLGSLSRSLLPGASSSGLFIFGASLSPPWVGAELCELVSSTFCERKDGIPSSLTAPGLIKSFLFERLFI